MPSAGCAKMDLLDTQIMKYDGRDKLRDYLERLPELSDFEKVESIGVVRDADNDSRAACESVRDSLKKAQLWPTDQQVPIENEDPRVSILLVPPTDSQGCLESLLWQAVENKPLAKCIHDYIDCAEIPVGNRRSKALVHAYIAAQRKPGLKIGEATWAGYWKPKHPAFEPVRDFLSEPVRNEVARLLAGGEGGWVLVELYSALISAQDYVLHADSYSTGPEDRWFDSEGHSGL